jgi:hypothetical protein
MFYSDAITSIVYRHDGEEIPYYYAFPYRVILEKALHAHVVAEWIRTYPQGYVKGVRFWTKADGAGVCEWVDILYFELKSDVALFKVRYPDLKLTQKKPNRPGKITWDDARRIMKEAGIDLQKSSISNVPTRTKTKEPKMTNSKGRESALRAWETIREEAAHYLSQMLDHQRQSDTPIGWDVSEFKVPILRTMVKSGAAEVRGNKVFLKRR